MYVETFKSMIPAEAFLTFYIHDGTGKFHEVASSYAGDYSAFDHCEVRDWWQLTTSRIVEYGVVLEDTNPPFETEVTK